jgi:hypothetical protein
MRHEGRCHCGNLRVTFETAQDPARMGLRRCGCTFCLKHCAVWVTDPQGTLTVRVAEEAS